MQILVVIGVAIAAPAQASAQSPSPQQPPFASLYSQPPTYQSAPEAPASVEWSERTEWRITPPRFELPRFRRVRTPEARLLTAPPPRVEPRAIVQWQYPVPTVQVPAPAQPSYSLIPPPVPPGKLLPAPAPSSLPPLPTKAAVNAAGASSCDSRDLRDLVDRLGAIQSHLERLDREIERIRDSGDAKPAGRQDPLPNPDMQSERIPGPDGWSAATAA